MYGVNQQYSYPVSPTVPYMPQSLYSNPVPAQAPSAPPQSAQPADNSARSNCQWIFVSGLAQVHDHIVPPNKEYYFMDNNKMCFYVKTADNFGTATTRVYEFKEITENEFVAADKQQTDEIAAIKQRLDKIESYMRRSGENEPISQ
jgi:hypothetical protein